MKDIKYDFIAEIYPKNRLTLLHGTYGSGKSFSVIKSLNRAKIEPLYVNLDETAGLDNLKFTNLNHSFLTALINNEIEDIGIDNIIIIDTYTRLQEQYTDEKEIAKILESLTRYGTIIVIGHTADFVGKDGIFRDNPILARNSAETLWLEKTEYKATRTRESYIDFNLHINKGRGNGGSRLIKNWMRD